LTVDLLVLTIRRLMTGWEAGTWAALASAIFAGAAVVISVFAWLATSRQAKRATRIAEEASEISRTQAKIALAALSVNFSIRYVALPIIKTVLPATLVVKNTGAMVWVHSVEFLGGGWKREEYPRDEDLDFGLLDAWRADLEQLRDPAKTRADLEEGVRTGRDPPMAPLLPEPSSIATPLPMHLPTGGELRYLWPGDRVDLTAPSTTRGAEVRIEWSVEEQGDKVSLVKEVEFLPPAASRA
jgi:hypothetical protein